MHRAAPTARKSRPRCEQRRRPGAIFNKGFLLDFPDCEELTGSLINLAPRTARLENEAAASKEERRLISRRFFRRFDSTSYALRDDAVHCNDNR